MLRSFKSIYLMKFPLSLLIIISFLMVKTTVYGQVKDIEHETQTNTFKVGFGVLTNVQFMTAPKELNALNQLLDKRSLPTLYPAANAVGMSFNVSTKKLTSVFEFVTLNWTLTEKDLTAENWLVPKFEASSFRAMVLSKAWERGRKKIEWGLGISSNIYTFRLVDRRPVPVSFDSLLSRPTSASASFDAQPSRIITNLDGRIGYVYNTQWFKKMCSAYEFSVFLGYSQAVFRPKKWVVKNTNVEIPNFPNVNFSNAYIQFSNNIYFKW